MYKYMYVCVYLFCMTSYILCKVLKKMLIRKTNKCIVTLYRFSIELN